jgi:hypothetical protein
MNARAQLVDSWRLIAFNANALRSFLNVSIEGDVRTTGMNPLNFNGHTGRLRASVQIDPPLTRLLERNNYRQQLIDYQQSRRQLIQFDDQLSQSLRARLRNMAQLRVNLEIQRRAVIIAIRRVDFTRAELNRPLPLPASGAPPSTFGPTAVQNLLSALSDLSNVQNNFMSVWLNYYAERLQLVRDLGVMQLDAEGRWVDRPLDELLGEVSVMAEELPPPVPEALWDLIPQIDAATESTGTGPAAVETRAPSQAGRRASPREPLPTPQRGS